MRHSFRPYQELLRVDAAAALRAARSRWPASGAGGGGVTENEDDKRTPYARG
jgi:hypothetical protein